MSMSITEQTTRAMSLGVETILTMIAMVMMIIILVIIIIIIIRRKVGMRTEALLCLRHHLHHLRLLLAMYT